MIDAYFSGTKLRWILDNVPGARSRREAGQLAFGTIDTWLVWKLTGGAAHVTDVSNASRTMLFNIHTGDWDDELLELFSTFRARCCRKCVPSSEVVRARPRAICSARAFRSPASPATSRRRCSASAASTPGMVKNTYGTGCFMLMNTGDKPVPSRNKLLTTVGWRIDGSDEYALEGSVFIAGAVVQWLRDGLGIIKSAAEVEALAAGVPDNGGVYLVPAFAGLGARTGTRMRAARSSA